MQPVGLSQRMSITAHCHGLPKLSKAKKALFTSDGSMKSESPEKVDFGVQWEPLDVTSDHEPRSSNSSLGDASHEDRSSGSAIQHDSESITHENLELMKDVEGAGGDRGQESRHSTEEPRCRKRKRKERLRDGLRGMLNEDHRARQMRALSRVVLGDFKQRMFMHQHKIRSIQQLISSQPPSQQVFEKLKEILGSEHDLLLVLVSFLFPDDMLPEAILNDPLRKAYASAIEMLLNIEAYATFGRSKFSARSIFRSVRELGPFCTSEELQARLYEVVGGERPLWSALSAYLPSAAHPQTHQTYEYECVDTASWDEADAEWEDVDVSCLLKSDAERRRKPAVIVNGKLLVEKKGKLCEAVACFKCEEAANAEGRPQTDDETVAVDEIVKETDADTSEVEILDVEDCITLVDEKTVSRDGAVENISRSKRMHGNITGEEAGNADEWGEAENVAKKDDTMVTSLNMDVNESNEMEGSKTVGSMGTKCTLNGEIIGSSEKLFIKEQIHKEKKKESSYNKISRRKVEKDEAKRYSDKQETFTEKWLESNSEVKTSKNLCRRSHLGEVSTNGKEITAEGKKTREKNDAKEDEIRDKDRPNFSKVSECANFVKMGSDDPISKETSPSAKEVEEPSSKSNYNAADGLQMDLVPESGSERVLMTNNGRGENTTKFKRSAEIANKDGSLLGASRKKISRGSSEEQFSEERRAMGRLSMAFECSQRNGDEMTGFQLYGQRCPATENSRRSSEPDLSPVKRLDGQNPRASLRSEYNRQLSSSYHPSRQRRSRSGSADNDCSHWRRDLKGRSTVHRSEHGSRFGRWHKEKGDRCYQEELSIHDQYGQVRRRDPDRREMWSKCSKYEREGALRSRRGTPRTNPERSTYQRHSSGRSQRFSSECDHKVSPNMRIERYDMPKFDRMEGRREKRRRDRQQWNDRRDESHLQRGGKKTLVTENRENPKGCYERTKDSRSPGSDFEGDGSRKSFIKRSEKCLRSFSNSRCERSHITSKQRPYGSRDSEPEEAPIKRMRVELTSSVSSADHDERPTVCCSTLDRRLTEQIELEPGELISDESFSGLEDVVLMTQEQPETEPNLSTKRERAFEKMDWGEIVDGSCRQTPTCSSDRGITKTSYTEREACSGIDGNIHKQQCSVSRCESRSLPKNSCDEQSEGGSLAFEEVSKRFKRNWSREDDGQLLHAYNEFDGDIEKVVCAFAQSVHLNDLQEVRERLLFLLSFFN
ncbi:hypothetical protein Tcan_09661 [Toxocara canis]|uniref:Uncharacterized protein n=1 Tax=Toxocara canis TaxID=6265 RepID=A0A0B2UZH2_TOXCA|nr:hypothetical protein Tcan_09661 [Toxocara canis]